MYNDNITYVSPFSVQMQCYKVSQSVDDTRLW